MLRLPSGGNPKTPASFQLPHVEDDRSGGCASGWVRTRRGVLSHADPSREQWIDREIVANASSDVIAQQALPIPPNLEGLSDREGARLLAEVGANQWVPRDRLAWLRESLRLLLDPMAVMLAIAAVIYAVLGETRDAVVLALALIPVLGVDVLLEARSRTALAKLARAAAPDAEVVRGGKVLTLAFEEVCNLGISSCCEKGTRWPPTASPCGPPTSPSTNRRLPANPNRNPSARRWTSTARRSTLASLPDPRWYRVTDLAASP